ncbi:MAG: type II toxin-antitoxin system VapC family toxin [Magnetococcales bacterium]|nr:type II toxin-antitoxin system VapC family toxin [Magnetococcales bacterium]
MAYEQGLSTYDASYLDLALREGIPIATFDHSLQKAASRLSLSLFAL